jgi:uncharacterized damage-inducible protein DinB
MKMTELFLAQLEREAEPTRRTLERVPEGQYDWKPHPKSMTLGYLAETVARMPGWIASAINRDELDMSPDGGRGKPPQLRTRRELVEALDKAVAQAREALSKTSDEHLLTTWKLMARGQVLNEQARHIVISDGVFNHLAHHRGQLTVYLRLNGAPVPAIYGPSADEGGFG